MVAKRTQVARVYEKGLTPLALARERIDGALGDVVSEFRERASLHYGSPDWALVDFAHGAGKDRDGAHAVRLAYEVWRRKNRESRHDEIVEGVIGEAVEPEFFGARPLPMTALYPSALNAPDTIERVENRRRLAALLDEKPVDVEEGKRNS